MTNKTNQNFPAIYAQVFYVLYSMAVCWYQSVILMVLIQNFPPSMFPAVMLIPLLAFILFIVLVGIILPHSRITSSIGYFLFLFTILLIPDVFFFITTSNPQSIFPMFVVFLVFSFCVTIPLTVYRQIIFVYKKPKVSIYLLITALIGAFFLLSNLLSSKDLTGNDWIPTILTTIFGPLILLLVAKIFKHV